MTVVIGFIGTDGAVMASDTEGQEADRTRRDIDKIWRCGSLLCGYTGQSSVQQPLRVALQARVEAAEDGGPIDKWQMRAHIAEACRPVLQGAYDNHVPRPAQGEVPQALSGALLVIGRDNDGFWLLEIDARNSPSWYSDPGPGFHAVGSGSTAAQVARGLLEHYEPVERSVAHLRLLAYRTVATCISVLGGAYGVGGDVRIWNAEGDVEFAQLDEGQMERVKNGVEQWTTIEAESLDRVVLEEAAPEAEGEEMPEELAEPQGDQQEPDQGPPQ
jgi:20S proteasome alpha/beta subunit